VADERVIMKKLFIKNRKNQKICVVVETPKSAKGLAFVMHGLGGFKDQPFLIKVAEAFLENNFTTVKFDTTNTFGESDGKYEDATLTNYYEDLEDVIKWAEGESWYKEPFILAGHSLGGISCALFSEKYPEKIKALILISPVISGQLTLETEYGESIKGEWKRSGWHEEKSISKPGEIKRLPWLHMEDRIKYDLRSEAQKLIMPLLLIVGSKDETTPLEHQKLLFGALPEGNKELRVIKGAHHMFRKDSEIAELKKVIFEWVKSV